MLGIAWFTASYDRKSLAAARVVLCLSLLLLMWLLLVLVLADVIVSVVLLL